MGAWYYYSTSTTIHGLQTDLERTNERIINESRQRTEAEQQISSLTKIVTTHLDQAKRNSTRAYVKVTDRAWSVSDYSMKVSDSLLSSLPLDWGEVTVSKVDNGYLVSRETEVAEVDEAIFEKTEDLFQANLSREPLNEYTYWLWFHNPFELTINETTQTLPAQQLIPITTTYWQTGLSFCSAEIDFSNTAFEISCGGGDNGCFTLRTVRMNLFTKNILNQQTCSNSCDLASDQTYTFTCNTF